MVYDIELFQPNTPPSAGARTDSLGSCKIITRNVFVTVTEHNGDAHLVLLDELSELDRMLPRLTTTIGRAHYPRRIDLPAKIFVETESGHARAVNGDQIARMTATKREAPKTGRISW